MEMLISTDANIIAFEPNPSNLYAMLSSIKALPQSYQSRVAVVPVALGGTKHINTIYAAENNKGNSVHRGSSQRSSNPTVQQQ